MLLKSLCFEINDLNDLYTAIMRLKEGGKWEILDTKFEKIFEYNKIY